MAGLKCPFGCGFSGGFKELLHHLEKKSTKADLALKLTDYVAAIQSIGIEKDG